MIEINSSDNKIYKYIKSLKQKKNRAEDNCFILEGKRLAFHALSLGITPLYLVFSKSFYEKTLSEIELLDKNSIPKNGVYLFSDKLFEGISETQNPQGVLGVFGVESFESSKAQKELDFLQDNNKFSNNFNNVLVLDRVQDPGNLGTIIRNCDAFGIKDLYLIKGSADPFSSKVLRSAMGSIFNVRLHLNCDIDDLADKFLKENRELLITGLSDSVEFGEYVKNKSSAHKLPIAIVLGNEGNGTDIKWLKYSHTVVRIPMVGSAESLNVAVASGILLYALM